MNARRSRGIQLIDMEVKPLPLGLLVMWIEQGVGVICSFYQTEVMAGLNNVSCCSGSVCNVMYEIVAARLSGWLILLEISRDRAIFQIGRFGVRGFSHHEEQGHDGCDDE